MAARLRHLSLTCRAVTPARRPKTGLAAADAGEQGGEGGGTPL